MRVLLLFAILAAAALTPSTTLGAVRREGPIPRSAAERKRSRAGRCILRCRPTKTVRNRQPATSFRNVAPPPLFTGGEDKIEGPVQCLTVAGNLASIIFTVKKTNSTNFGWSTVAWTVQDNGNPNDNTTPDMAGWNFASPSEVARSTTV